jgi:cyclic beta-1,2-glucan synthetase
MFSMLSADLASASSRSGWTANDSNGSALGGDGQALRAELFSVSQLERHAKALAGQHEISTSRQRRPHLLERLGENEALFDEVYAHLTRAVERGLQVSPAAEWFIDNHHIIEDQIQTARRHLPRSYHRELPRLANALVPGTPRVYDLAIELISHSHGRVDQLGLLAFVEAYQSLQPLRMGELWAIPIMLRLALLENLRRVVASVALERRERERATHWVSELEASGHTVGALVAVLARLLAEAPGMTDTFIAELASRLQSRGAPMALAMSWLEQHLAEHSQTIEHAVHLVAQNQAADQVSVSNSIGSLRLLGATDWRVFVESSSTVERVLRTDPTHTYAAMDFTTRDRYRHAVEGIAKHSEATEEDVARMAIRLARAQTQHVGVFLITPEVRTLEKAVGMQRTLSSRGRALLSRSHASLYGGSLLTLTALITTLLGLFAPAPATWALGPWWLVLTLAASMGALAIVHLSATLLVGPKLLPRLDFSQGIPVDARTIVAVPSMLTRIPDIDDLIESLEVRFLANRDPNLAFALVTDFRDAKTETTSTDEQLLQHAAEAIDALNLKYAPPLSQTTPPFFLAHRARSWNPSEGVWMGWERKRGKLEDFNELLRGSAERFSRVIGPFLELDFRYVIVLDSDTELPRDAAHLLAATMAHPLNRPVFDETLGRVTRGYAVLQPRVGVSMASTSKSRFARLFAGEPGIDPYTRAVSDVFQDVFSEGSFVGKGIYDVDMVRTALAGRLPDNRVLSHDLLEGAYARAGLVSDVELVEDFPSSHAAEVARRSRWIRGDWQIASWLLPMVVTQSSGRPLHPVERSTPPVCRRNPTSWLSRWKIFDNLRRSVVPIALTTLLLGGWFMAGGAAFATIAVALILFVPGLLIAATALMRRPDDQRRGPHLRELFRTMSRQVLRESFVLSTLPYDAYVAAVAIVTTLWRLLFSHRRLLVWRTAAEAQRGARLDLLGAVATLWFAPTFAMLVTTALMLWHPDALPWAGPILTAWLLSPVLVWWMSRPLVATPARISTADMLFLRSVARRTWRFFSTFVGPRDHYLPPDNFQEDPPVGIAHRTSPTNMGLSLIANLAAHDFGYLTTTDLIARITPALDTMDSLPRFRGHFFNWYDTTTLEPLKPMYVSTVDSGNLSGHLLTLASGLDELTNRPSLDPQFFAGLQDTLAQVSLLATWPAIQVLIASLQTELGQALVTLTQSARRLHIQALVRGSHELTASVRMRCESPSEPLEWAMAFESACISASDTLSSFAPWLDGRAVPEDLDQVLALTAHTRLVDTPHPHALHGAVLVGATHASRVISQLQALAARCRAMADFECDFLYDRTRKLLSIGYHVEDQRTDLSYYDLLASEARLASFVAIALGRLPQEHWFSLGRQLTLAGGRATLVSWSGSMFEYLMPMLVMPNYDQTLLDETNRAVVSRQVAYGRELDLPWGVSESGYNKTDTSLNYQYRAFGVPGLGFKRGLGDDRVITPYASALALMVSPEAATQNLRRLAAEDMLGAYGFYEARDYTHSRLPPGRTAVTIQSYMAHHQGMVFLSLVHLLCDRPMQRRFDADPAFRATNLLLQERIPRTTTVLSRPPALSTAVAETDSGADRLRVYTTAMTFAPEVHLLSNGAYHVVVTNSGGGYSRWRDLAITRWREDTTRDCWVPSATCATWARVPSGPSHISRRFASRPPTRPSFRPVAPSSADWTTTSTHTSRSVSRPKTTSSCAVSASPIGVAHAAPSSSRVMPRSSWHRPLRTWHIRPSATSLSRPRSWPTRSRSSSHADRARKRNTRPGCSTTSPCTAPRWGRPPSRRRGSPLSVAARPPSTPSRCTSRHSPTPRVRCWTPSSPSAEPWSSTLRRPPISI